MVRIQEFHFDDRATLARELATAVAFDLAEALEARGTASLVVSGGSTPRPFFQELSGRSLGWDRVTVTLADERWVPPDNLASNELLVRENLLVGTAESAKFQGLWNDSPTPGDGQAATDRALEEVPRPFDILVLGMGGDGHTASLFPEAPELAEGLDLETSRLSLAVHPPEAEHPRISLTLAALLRSRRIVLHITGEDKAEVLRRALGPGPEEELPIRAVLRHSPIPVDVFWAP